jgi:hypothetical protein
MLHRHVTIGLMILQYNFNFDFLETNPIKIYEIKITMKSSFCMGVMQSQSLGVTV